ncbi:glycine cleavage T C-terminal barrel domain-containing protein, partial [Salipiger bermudensis]
LPEIASGAPSVRVGLKPEGRAPMREGIDLYESEAGGEPVGRITSGGFGPTVGGPVAMGYVPAEQATPGTRLYGEVRGKRLPVEVVTLPHVKQSYKR